MKLQAALPLVTYPDPNSDKIAEKAVAVARQLDASLHAFALNVEIPDVSNRLSRLLLDVPAMIREAKTTSNARGKHLLALVEEKARAAGIELSQEETANVPAMLGEAAATTARYFDLSLLGWEGQNPGSRLVAEAVVFGSGRPTVLLPEMSGVATLDHVAIAWDGSRVAARAVTDARPFLALAKKISLQLLIQGCDRAVLDADHVFDGNELRLRSDFASDRLNPLLVSTWEAIELFGRVEAVREQLGSEIEG